MPTYRNYFKPGDHVVDRLGKSHYVLEQNGPQVFVTDDHIWYHPNNLTKIGTGIMSIREIVALMREQANLRSMENDDAGLLQDLADQLAREHRELHAGEDASEF